ncbi:hypothetical protein [Streptomyces sp. NPDC055036]
MRLHKPGNFAEAFLCRLVQSAKVNGRSKVGGHQPATVPGDELQPNQRREIGTELFGVEAIGDYRIRGALVIVGVGQ